MYLYSILSKHANKTSARNNVLVQPLCYTSTYSLSSVRYCGPNLRNDLDKQLKESISFENFKRNILNWCGPVCSCQTCKLCALKCAVLYFLIYVSRSYYITLICLVVPIITPISSHSVSTVSCRLIVQVPVYC